MPDPRAPALPDPAPLGDWLPDGSLADPEAILDRFLAWVAAAGLEPYPHQEEALLELFAGRHVVLSTPTGSGKSLVATALHFKALCEGRRSFYTAPIKALVSEKFFAACQTFGAARVGMLTGDASVNWAAPVICCTQEVLANLALRRGEACDAPYVVMDEFHYYDDRERGWAWQVPLLALPRTTFLLMSATLGNTDPIERALARRTGRAVAHVHSDERPVPLDFSWRDTPLHESVEALLEEGRAPVYIVHFTQREAALQAQGLTSARLASRERRAEIADAVGGFRFDSPYGRDVRRFLSHGIGIHHAGLLPKYRLLVEQLAQRSLLPVICGTDTLGVGVNIPIRTVLFSRLCKFDGEKVGILSVREFKQIAGRAGRKGFDERGSVVCQAPEHVVENKRLAAKGGRRASRKKRPPRNLVPWTEETFRRLVEQPPEMLRSRFRVSHGMLVSLLQRTPAGPGGGYRLMAELVALSHESERSRRALRREAAQLFRSLRAAGIVSLEADPQRPGRGSRVVVNADLQRDFTLHHTLSLYLVDAVAALDPDHPDYALDVLSVVEAILEDPRPILLRQRDRAVEELLARLKAEGVPYEERMAKLDEVEPPRPCARFIDATFDLFAERHPWASRESIRPKSVAREMLERYEDFADTVRRYGIQRSEGLLLRYLSQVHNTLVRNVPEAAKTDEVLDVAAFLHALLARVDSSLVEEWESLVRPGAGDAETEAEAFPRERPPFDLARHPQAFAARVRAELHALVRALAAGRTDDAAACVCQDPEDPWDAARFEAALRPFLDEHGRIVFDPRARRADQTLIRELAPRRYGVWQTLLDPVDENLWSIEGEVELPDGPTPPGPLVRMRRIGT